MIDFLLGFIIIFTIGYAARHFETASWLWGLVSAGWEKK